jgi:hypothetical protein
MLLLLAGITLGYLLFAFTAVVIFQVLGRDPHAAAEPSVMVGTIGAGLIAAFVGGYVAAMVARGRERTAGLVVGGIIAIAAVAALVAQPGEGAKWSQLSALVMAPVAALGSVIRARLRSRSVPPSFGEASTKPR